METKTLEKMIVDSRLLNLEQGKLRPFVFAPWKNIQYREKVKYEVYKENKTYGDSYVRISINMSKECKDNAMIQAADNIEEFMGKMCFCLKLSLMLL